MQHRRASVLPLHKRGYDAVIACAERDDVPLGGWPTFVGVEGGDSVRALLRQVSSTYIAGQPAILAVRKSLLVELDADTDEIGRWVKAHGGGIAKGRGEEFYVVPEQLLGP